MWLHLPPGFSPSSRAWEGLISPSDSPSHLLARSATWSGKSIPPSSWQRVCVTEPSIPLLSGLTFAPSTVDRGAESWIASLEVSPARTSARPGREPDSLAHDPGYGLSTPASWRKSDQESSSSRTSRPSSSGDSTGFSATWPRWGSMRSGACSARPGSGRLTAGKGSSFWPTPTARDWKDGAATGNEPTNGILGRTAARWTPSHPDQTPATGSTSPKMLNPRFVEWLMGLPLGWTDYAPVETESFRSWQRTHTELLQRVSGADEWVST